MKARAIVHEAPNQVGLQEFELRDPGPAEVLVAARYTCVSPGTELRCLAGKQPDAVPFPYIPGYSMAGEILQAGPQSGRKPGERVYLNGTGYTGHLGRQWGGHASHAVAQGAECIPVPPGLDLCTASLAHLAAIALNGVQVAKPVLGETVAVVGLGVIGQLCARLYAAAGCRVVAADRAPSRVQCAAAAGLQAVLVEGTLPQAMSQVLPEGADIVVDATGAPAAFAEALALAREVPWGDPPVAGPRYVVQGSYPDVFCVPYQAAFRKELNILIPRDCRPSQRRQALEMLADGRLNAQGLISRVCAPEEAPDIYRALADPSGGLLTAAFQWQ